MMSSLKTVVLCAVGVVITAVVAVSTASAAAVWESCRSGVTGTKFTSNQCTTASGTGEFGWAEIKGTEEAKTTGTIRLTDTKVPVIGKVTITCTSEVFGSAGPGRFGRINEILNVRCTPGENCEELRRNAVPLNLPYQGELFETEKKVEGKTTGTKEGNEPGIEITCRVLGLEKTDRCEYAMGVAPEVGSFENTATKTGTTVLLVMLTALKVSKQNCSIGGRESGEQEGSAPIVLTSGAGLRVS
jgi:hypothetical protein